MWSRRAAIRALPAVLVIPAVFALTYEGFGNPQMALFAAFGGFANLIVASFGGTRRDKIVAHLGLAVTGGVALTIGTAVSGIEWLAVLVTIPVAFGIFFAGVAGPNAASGVNGALFGYLLPLGTPGTVGTIPDRLAGWWLASVAATVAVLLLSPPSPGDRLRAAAARSARELAARLEASVSGAAGPADRDCVPAGKGRADERVREDAVPADRAGDGRPGAGQRRSTARVVHHADRRRYRRPPAPRPRPGVRPRAVRRDRRGTQAGW